MKRELHVRQVDAHSLRLMFSFEGSTFKNLYLENFTQKNKEDLVIDEMTRHL